MSNLSSLLVKYQVVNLKAIQKALERQVIYGGDLTTNILELGIMSEEVLAFFLGKLYNLPWISKKALEDIRTQDLDIIPVELAVQYKIIPFDLSGDILKIALCYEPDLKKLGEISFLVGFEFEPHITTEYAIFWAYNKYYQMPLDDRFKEIEKKLYLEPPPPPGADTILQMNQWEPPRIVLPTNQTTILNKEESIDNINQTQEQHRIGPLPVDTQQVMMKYNEIASLIEKSENREEILDYLILFLNNVFEFSAIFSVQKNEMILRRSLSKIGPLLPVNEYKRFNIHNETSIDWVVKTKKEFIGPVGINSAQNDNLLSFLHRDPPANAVLIPIIIKDRVILIIYGDKGKIPVVHEDIPFAFEIIKLVQNVLIKLILKKKTTTSQIQDEDEHVEMDDKYILYQPDSVDIFVKNLEDERQTVSDTRDEAEIEYNKNQEQKDDTQQQDVQVIKSEEEKTEENIIETIDNKNNEEEFKETIKESEYVDNVENNQDSISEETIVDNSVNEDKESVINDKNIQPQYEESKKSKIILDLGPEANKIVDDYINNPDKRDELEPQIIAFGEEIIPIIMQHFPGPLEFDRHNHKSPLPRVILHGPVLKLLLKFGRKIITYIVPLLTSADSEKRFYATFMFSELIFPEVILPLSERLFDSDIQIRILTIDILKSFRHFDEYQNIIKQLTEIALNENVSSLRRYISIMIMGELRDPQVVPYLFELLDKDDKSISQKAYSALIIITKQDFGNNSKKWIKWWESNKDKSRVEWLIDGLNNSDDKLRASSIEEIKRIFGSRTMISSKMSRKELQKIQKELRDMVENDEDLKKY